MLPDSFKDGVSAAIALVLLGVFAFVHVSMIIKSCQATKDEPPPAQHQMQYIATALAGLIGGVVAMNFNQNLPSVDNGQKTVAVKRTGPSEGGQAVVEAVAPEKKRGWQGIVGAAYVIVYCLCGFAAIFTWMIRGNERTQGLVKNLAMISLGLFIAISRDFVPSG